MSRIAPVLPPIKACVKSLDAGWIVQWQKKLSRMKINIDQPKTGFFNQFCC